MKEATKKKHSIYKKKKAEVKNDTELLFRIQDKTRVQNLKIPEEKLPVCNWESRTITLQQRKN